MNVCVCEMLFVSHRAHRVRRGSPTSLHGAAGAVQSPCRDMRTTGRIAAHEFARTLLVARAGHTEGAGGGSHSRLQLYAVRGYESGAPSAMTIRLIASSTCTAVKLRWL